MTTSNIKQEAYPGLQKLRAPAGQTTTINIRIGTVFFQLSNTNFVIALCNGTNFNVVFGTLPTDVAVTKPTADTLQIVNNKTYLVTGFLFIS